MSFSSSVPSAWFRLRRSVISSCLSGDGASSCVHPSSAQSAVSDSGARALPIASIILSGLTSSSFASSLTLGSTPFFAMYSLLSFAILSDSSYTERLTFIAPPSRNSRFISPAITGKA